MRPITYANRRNLFIGAAAVMLLAMTAAARPGHSSDRLKVYVVNYPLQYMTERIGGEHVQVFLPVPADVDPAYWMPDIDTITAYQQADLIILNGAGYAHWVGTASLPRSKLVDTSSSFSDRFITNRQAVTHSHGPGGKHAHENLAFTTWLNFNLAGIQADAIARAIISKKPELKSAFTANHEALKSDLKTLDTALAGIVARNPKKPFVASHPVYDYLAQRYGLNLNSVHWEPDSQQTPEQWQELQAILKDHPASWMIWEGEPFTETKNKLQSIGIRSLVFDPCANVPKEGDFMTVMQKNIMEIKRAFP